MNRIQTLHSNLMKNKYLNRNIYHEFLKNIQQNPNKTLFYQKNKNNEWQPHTNIQLFYKIQDCRDFLQQNKIQKNDKIIYNGKNSVDWFAWNMATLSVGALWVPIYHNQNNEYIQHVINDAQPKILIHDSNENFQIKNQKYNKQFKNLLIHQSNVKENKSYIHDNYVHNETSHLIYTSGTSGTPKGVILTHNNLLSNIDAMNNHFIDLKNHENLKTFNILPWAHIYSLNTELYYNVLNQNIIYLNSHQNLFLKELYHVQPHVVYLVPRILEEIHKKLSFLEKSYIPTSIVLPFVLKKLFGENLITIFTGGAKLQQHILDFYQNNKITICEGYGTTEASPMISVNHMHSPRNTFSIGKILDNIDVEIIDGEICVHGPNITQGYYNDSEKTKRSFIYINHKKYYKTGDAGKKVNDFLFYEGRISSNYKLSNGKFIEKDKIEGNIKHLLKEPFIIYGNNQPYNIIIKEYSKSGYKENKHKLMNNINKLLQKYAHIRDILYVDNDVFSKFLTPKMSLKVNEFILHHKEKIDEFYKKSNK